MNPSYIETPGEDILEGAPAIAKFLLGRDDKRAVRRIRYLLETGQIRAGKFGIGSRAIFTASKALLREDYARVVRGERIAEVA